MSIAQADVTETSFEQRNFERLRSPDTICAIGRTAISGYERRRYDEITSGLAEALSGVVSTHYEFELWDGKLVAADGEPFEELLLRGLREDIKQASADAFYEFLPERSRAELDNFRRMEAMARGETAYDTMIEVSPYTEELDTSESDRRKLVQAAQKPYWGRTMVRASHWDGRRLHILTLSSDNLPAAESFGRSGTSSVELFREAASRELNYDFKAHSSSQMLAEPIKLSATDNLWRDEARNLVSAADRLLAERHGGTWHQGRPENESVDLQQYVESQTQVLEGLLAAEKRLAAQYSDYEEYKAAFDQEMYKCAALLEARLRTGTSDKTIADYQSAADGAGASAAAEGRVFDMCGQVLSSSASQSQQQGGFESLMRLIDKKIHCPECSQKVEVPKDDLKEGKLSCTECGFWVDVCTGDKGYGKKKAGASKPAEPSGFDAISAALRKYAEEGRLKRLAEKQARADLGDNISYLDIKRYEKQLKNELAGAA